MLTYADAPHIFVEFQRRRAEEEESGDGVQRGDLDMSAWGVVTVEERGRLQGDTTGGDNLYADVC